jgi:hypothetical protein
MMDTVLESISNQSLLVVETMEIFLGSNQHLEILSSIVFDLIDTNQTTTEIIENSNIGQ